MSVKMCSVKGKG